MAADQLVCVGDRLASKDQYAAGAGTYVRKGFIYASITGSQTIQNGAGKPVLEVTPVVSSSKAIVPGPGDVVIVKVTKVAPQSVNTKIVCVGPHALDVDFTGTIRLQDVRQTEVDKVKLYDCFRPGDIVRAKVLSLGDARTYYLTTAENELGVVYAKSTAGAPMVAVSWQEMLCPETKMMEKRKVAKTAAATGAAAAATPTPAS